MSYSSSDHRLFVANESNGFGIERKTGAHSVLRFLKEEVNCPGIELQTDGLQKRNIESEDLFIREIKIQLENVVQVIIAEEIEDGCVTLDIQDHDAQCLQNLGPGSGVLCLDWSYGLT